jgi:hypothetical protein
MGNSSSFSRDKAAGAINSPFIIHLLQRLRMSTAIPSIPIICLHNIHRSNVTFTAMTYSKPVPAAKKVNMKNLKISKYELQTG